MAKELLKTFPASDLATTYWYPKYWRDTIVEERLTQKTIATPLALVVAALPLKIATTPLARLTLPLNCQKVDTSGYDTVVTSGAWMKGVVTEPGQTHVAYIHTPIRFVHDLYPQELGRRGEIRKTVFAWIAKKIRSWEHVTAQYPDKLLANSENTKKRIEKYYGRDAEVIYPPVDIKDFENKGSDGFFFTIGRLWKEKHTEEIAEAFTDLDRKLVIAGTGPRKKRIKKIAKNNENVEYRGYVSREEKLDLYGRCEAFVFNAEDEDFGLTPIEANAAGKPVITTDEGGISESQNEDTAVFFDGHGAKQVKEAIEQYLSSCSRFDPATAQENAERFRVERFREEITEAVEEVDKDV